MVFGAGCTIKLGVRLHGVGVGLEICIALQTSLTHGFALVMLRYTLKQTVYVPGDVYVWFVLTPYPKLPSPKFQIIESEGFKFKLVLVKLYVKALFTVSATKLAVTLHGVGLTTCTCTLVQKVSLQIFEVPNIPDVTTKQILYTPVVVYVCT
jgi:hypothetical protein